MSVRHIQRGPTTGGPPPGLENLPNATAVYIDGVTDELVVGVGTSGTTGASATPVRNLRTRVPIASINAGATLLPALAGRRYRLIDASVIAIGGAVGAVTTIDILGTQASVAVKLMAFAQAQLTQSTVLYPGTAGTTILADGASFAACDVNTPITIGKTGATATTATHVDVNVAYAIE